MSIVLWLSRRKALTHFRLYTAAALLLFLWFNMPLFADLEQRLTQTDFELEAYHAKLRHLPGANDTLVIMRTGSTELQDKLPIHLSTTLRRYPNYLIFSDYEENFEGHHILDALENVDSLMKATHPDFGLWRRLKVSGRVALQQEELSGTSIRIDPGTGKADNPGWKLDKFKFLPMVNRTLYEYPDKRWYIFVEPDTFIFWQTILVYLSNMDWTKPYYMGGQINIGDITFGQGGNSFVASRSALENVVSHYQAHQKEWEDFTDGHWAGDCVLGKAFRDSGTPLTGSWPTFQGDDIGNMNYRQQGLWCQPTVSYHHVSPAAIQSLSTFEQEWMKQGNHNGTSYLRHKDVFKHYILPQITTPSQRPDWDNHSDDDQGPVESLESCRAICDANGGCLQYAIDTENRCLTTSRPNLGQPASGIASGWMVERVQRFYDDGGEC